MPISVSLPSSTIRESLFGQKTFKVKNVRTNLRDLQSHIGKLEKQKELFQKFFETVRRRKTFNFQRSQEFAFESQKFYKDLAAAIRIYQKLEAFLNSSQEKSRDLCENILEAQRRLFEIQIFKTNELSPIFTSFTFKKYTHPLRTLFKNILKKSLANGKRSFKWLTKTSGVKAHLTAMFILSAWKFISLPMRLTFPLLVGNYTFWAVKNSPRITRITENLGLKAHVTALGIISAWNFFLPIKAAMPLLVGNYAFWTAKHYFTGD